MPESAPAILSLAAFAPTNYSLAVYTGDSLATLSPINVVLATSRTSLVARFAVEGSKRYFASVKFLKNTPYFWLRLEAGSAPLNDHFSNRHTLLGSHTLVSNSLYFASREPNEKDLSGALGPLLKTIWYRWTAPSDGELSLRVFSPFSDTSPIVALAEEAEGVASLKPLGVVRPPNWGGPWGPPGPRSTLSGLVAAGASYVIVVDATRPYPDVPPRDVALELNFSPAPANDAANAPELLQGNTVERSGSLHGASSETNNIRDVFYHWTSPISGYAALTFLEGADYSAEVLFADPSGFKPLTRFGEFASFPVEQGGDYLLRVYGSKAQPGGPFRFTLTTEAPQNDAFASAIEVHAFRTNFLSRNFLATTEPGEPSGLSNTTWWSWTAPADGWVHLRGHRDLRFHIFKGENLSQLSRVEALDLEPPASGASGVLFGFSSEKGATYKIAISSTNELGSNRRVSLDLTTLTFPQRFLEVTDHRPLSLQLAAPDPSIDGAFRDGEPLTLARVEGGGFAFRGITKGGTTTFRLTNQPLGEVILYARGENTAKQLRTSQPIRLRFRNNDDFENAWPIETWHRGARFNFTQATLQPGESPSPGRPKGGTLWWRWTAPFSGDASFTGGELGAGAQWDTFVSGATIDIYTGSSMEKLEPVPRFPGEVGRSSFPTVRGATYHFRVAATNIFAANDFALSPLQLKQPWDFVAGDSVPLLIDYPLEKVRSVEFVSGESAISYEPPFRVRSSQITGLLSTNCHAIIALKDGTTWRSAWWQGVVWRPRNDSFAHRINLMGSNHELSEVYSNASREPGEPAMPIPAAYGTLWWSWRAPDDGILALGRFGSDVLAAVYVGEDLSALRLVAGFENRQILPVSKGTTYQIVTTCPPLSGGGINLAFGVFDQNPDKVIEGDEVAFVVQQGTLPHGRTDRTFTWRCPRDGWVLLSRRSSTNPHTGDVNVRWNGYSVDKWFDYHKVYWRGQKDATYRIEFSAYDFDVSRSEWVLKLWSPSLTNDFFKDPVELPPVVDPWLVVPPDTAGSFEPGEPYFPDRESFYSGSFWCRWVAPFSGKFNLLSHGSGHAYVYQGSSLTSLVRVAPLNRTESRDFTFDAVEGAVYSIAVLTTRAERTYPVGISLHPAALEFQKPINDAFTNALHLSGRSFSVTLTNRYATREFGEPAHGGVYSGRTVWCRWRAPVTGRAEAQCRTLRSYQRSWPSPGWESASAFQFAIYTGASLQELQEVKSRAFPRSPADFHFDAIEGTEYVIAFSGAIANEFVMQLELDLVASTAVELTASLGPSGAIRILARVRRIHDAYSSLRLI